MVMWLAREAQQPMSFLPARRSWRKYVGDGDQAQACSVFFPRPRIKSIVAERHIEPARTPMPMANDPVDVLS